MVKAEGMLIDCCGENGAEDHTDYIHIKRTFATHKMLSLMWSLGGADKNLDYQEVVHIFARG